MKKVERMRALLESGDRSGAVSLAHELLTCHGHETPQEAAEAFEKHGAPYDCMHDVWMEAFLVVNP